MPVYNKESRIKKSIESALNQTYKNFELIIIDDGSTDNSKKIIENYKEKDSRIVLLEQDNKGVSYSRNLGLGLSKAEYISFLDADDELDSRFLENMVKSIEGSDICYCGHYYLKNGYKRKARMKFFKGDIFEKYLYNKCTPNTNSWLIRRSYINKYDIRFSTNMDWGEDMEFFSKVLLHSGNVKCFKGYLTYYYKDGDTCLSENNIDKIYKDIFWMEKLKEYILENEMDTKRRRKLLKAIDSYRLPALIIYRMYSNMFFLEEQEFIKIIKEVKEYTDKFGFTNGLRSLKLLYYKNKVLNYEIKN